MTIITGEKEFFKGIGQVNYEGPQSDNLLAFRWYDANRIVAGKTMKDHLRFACAYWHSFCGSGADPFGEPTHLFPWNEKADAIELEHIKTFSAKPLLIPYYKEVEKNFKKHFEETINKYAPFDDEKREALKKEIEILNSIINKIDKEFALTLHTSLSAYAEHVKKADKNNMLFNFIFPIPIHGFTD